MLASRFVTRCASSLRKGGSAASPYKLGGCLRQSLRNAATTAKPRAKKAATAKEEPAGVSKKNLSTTSTVPPSAKLSRKKTSAAMPATTSPGPATVSLVTPKLSTRGVSTKDSAVLPKPGKTTAASPKKVPIPSPKTVAPPKGKVASPPEADAKVMAPRVAEPVPRGEKYSSFAAPSLPRLTPTTLKSPPRPAPAPLKQPGATSPVPKQNPAVLAQSPRSAPAEPSRVSAASPEYKQASKKLTSVIVALPILLVTSYFLFDRLALGNQPKDLAKYRHVGGTQPEYVGDGERSGP